MYTIGATGAAAPLPLASEFSVALNSSVSLGLSSQTVPFTFVLAGNADRGFDAATGTYTVPRNGVYSFACTASFTFATGVPSGSSLQLSLKAGMGGQTLKTSVYTFQTLSTGTFSLTLTVAYAGFFEAQTPVYVSVLSTLPLANASTLLGPTVGGVAPWITLFRGRPIS